MHKNKEEKSYLEHSKAYFQVLVEFHVGYNAT